MCNVQEFRVEGSFYGSFRLSVFTKSGLITEGVPGSILVARVSLLIFLFALISDKRR